MTLPNETTPGSEANFPLSGNGLLNWLNTAGSFLFSEIPEADALLNFLRDNGVSIGIGDFLNVRSTVLARNEGVSSNEQSLTTLSDQYPDSLIPIGYTVENHGWELSDNFLYRFRVEGVNPDTGETQFVYMSVASEHQLTFQEALDTAQSLHTENYLDKGFVETDFAIDAAFVRPDYFG